MASEDDIDRSELFVRYLSRYERNLRAFIASLIDDWDAVDEILQSSSIVMWRKFDQFDVDGAASDFLSWGFMIARFEVMKYRTRMCRDRLVFSDEVHELISLEAEAMASSQSDRERALVVCLSRLPAAQRELVRAAYSSGKSIKQVAHSVGRTPTALYKALSRIRDNLHRCVETTLREGLPRGDQL